jgi:hypothetical protein
MSYGFKRYRGWAPRALEQLKELPVYKIKKELDTRKRTDFENEQLRYFDVIDFKEDKD